MKKYIIIITVLISALGMAQPGSEGRHEDHEDRKMAKEKIKALAVAYVTEQLELTPDEASTFWPVFNELRDQRYQIDRERRQLVREMEDKFESLTDSQAVEYVNKIAALEKKKYETSFEFNKDKFIKIVGAKRFLKLMKAETDFRRKMLREFKNRKGKERP